MELKPCEQTIYSIGEILLRQERTFHENLQEVVALLAENYEVARCSIMTINPEEQALEVVASTKTAIIGQKRKLSEVTIATRALLDNTPLTTNPKRLSYFRPQESSSYASSYSINIPFNYLDRKLGVIILSDPLNGEPLTEEAEVLAVETAKHIAPYIYAMQTREQLEAKVAKCEIANNQLLQMAELKSDLTNFIVHDLKGPISTIMANLDMLGYEELTPLQFEYLNLATSDIYKLQRMVMNILDVTKLEEGKVMVYREETDIYALAKREASSCRNSLAQRGVGLVMEGNTHICYIDENLVSRVISNLLLNAIDYSPEGSEIILKAVYDGDRHEAIVSVSDHGTGVPDEFKDKIFDKFFQIKSAQRQMKVTTGLGLAFCRLVVNAHGGSIWVEDTENGGATFKFTLPETFKEVAR